MQGTGCRVFSRVSCISSNVEIQVFEEGVPDALGTEDDLVSEGEKHDLLEFEGGQDRGVTLVLCAVMVPQGKDSLVGLGILGVCCQVVVEENHQGCQGDRVQVAIEVKGHREDVQCLELLENVDEALGVHLAQQSWQVCFQPSEV